VAEQVGSLVQKRKSSLCAAIERSRLGDSPLWTSNACERSLLLYPPTRNCDRFPLKSVIQRAIALFVAEWGEVREALGIP